MLMLMDGPWKESEQKRWDRQARLATQTWWALLLM